MEVFNRRVNTIIDWYEGITGTHCEPIEAMSKESYVGDLSMSIPPFLIKGKETILDGTYHYYAVAEDSAGNLSPKFKTTITLDRIAPVITDFHLTGSTGAPVTTSQKIVMNLEVSDNIGPLSMRYKFSYGTWTEWQTVASGKNRLSLEGAVPLPSQYQLFCEVKDGAGNTSSANALIEANRSPLAPDSSVGSPSGLVFSTAPQLLGPLFVDADGDTLAASCFLIRLLVTEEDGSTREEIVYSTGIIPGTDSWIYNVPDGVLTCDNDYPANYSWTLRYQDSFGQWSQWSAPVYFTLREPVLTVSVNGKGTGTVMSQGGEIDCGGDCTETCSPGESVTLTAFPGLSSAFLGWSGDGCSGTTPCALSMDFDKNVTATFAVMGDVNDSGTVDLADAIITLKLCAAVATTETIVKAAVNNDAQLGLEEGIYILQKIAALR